MCVFARKEYQFHTVVFDGRSAVRELVHAKDIIEMENKEVSLRNVWTLLSWINLILKESLTSV
jgi:hypothetical protein